MVSERCFDADIFTLIVLLVDKLSGVIQSLLAQ